VIPDKCHEEKKGKKKRWGISKIETLSFCEGRIPLDIVLSRNNRNFLPNALKIGKFFLVYLIWGGKSNFMKACDIIQIYPKSMVSSHIWHYNIILCTLQMNLPILTTSFLSPTKLHGYGKKGYSLYLYHYFYLLSTNFSNTLSKPSSPFSDFFCNEFCHFVIYIYCYFYFYFLKHNCQNWKIILKICPKLSQLPITWKVV